MDGKHISIRCPSNSGSLYYNYKQFYSIVLLAVCDAKMKVIYAHYGSFGSEGDAGIFGKCDFGKKLNNGFFLNRKFSIIWFLDELNLPMPKPLRGTDLMCPFYFVGDGAFPLGQHIMKPFGGVNLSLQQRAFNYRFVLFYLYMKF